MSRARFPLLWLLIVGFGLVLLIGPYAGVDVVGSLTGARSSPSQQQPAGLQEPSNTQAIIRGRDGAERTQPATDTRDEERRESGTESRLSDIEALLRGE